MPEYNAFDTALLSMTIVMNGVGSRKKYTQYALGYLGERVSRIEYRSQLVLVRSARNISLHLDRISIGPDYPICIDEHLPMLVPRVGRSIGSHWKMWFVRDTFHSREDLADGDVARVHFGWIVRAPKEDGENVRSGDILSEYAIKHRVA